MRNLGPIYHKNHTTWRCWAPSQESLTLRLYQKNEESSYTDHPMTRVGECHEITLQGDFHGQLYRYVLFSGATVIDPYAKASNMNSRHSAVVDLGRTNPPGWESHQRPATPIRDAIIYETHVKNFTYDISSGVEHRGCYLGFTERGTHYGSLKTGLDHLVELGITHVHFLPIQDYLTVNEDPETFHHIENYNWGYDPVQYFVPEGSYASNPDDPTSRIYECKALVKALHEAGLKVVLDVVYNHTYLGRDSNLEHLVPDYYYRKTQDQAFCNGSGCGNEIASERPMARHLILASLLYWQQEYAIDGFRFDLMGLMDLETYRQIVKELRERDPECLIYGEPWAAETPAIPEAMHFKAGDQRGMGTAIFNDAFRNAILGEHRPGSLGFAQGNGDYKDTILWAVQGSPGKFQDVQETINYCNSHDDLIMEDKLQQNFKDSEGPSMDQATRLAMDLIFLSQGIPFIVEGNEMRHNKQGRNNTYKGPITVNAIKWRDKETHREIFQYTKDLIALRKKLDCFNLSREEVEQRLTIHPEEQAQRLHWSIQDERGDLHIYINATESAWAPLSIREEVEQARHLLWTGRGPEDRILQGIHVEVKPYSSLIFRENPPTEGQDR